MPNDTSPLFRRQRILNDSLTCNFGAKNQFENAPVSTSLLISASLAPVKEEKRNPALKKPKSYPQRPRAESSSDEIRYSADEEDS